MVDQLEDKIRVRAQEIWEAEDRPSGKAEEHWRRASDELNGEANNSQPHPSSGASGISSSLQLGGTIPASSRPSSIESLGAGGGITGGAATGSRKKA